jgi:hypothetical protein
MNAWQMQEEKSSAGGEVVINEYRLALDLIGPLLELPIKRYRFGNFHAPCEMSIHFEPFYDTF